MSSHRASILFSALSVLGLFSFATACGEDEPSDPTSTDPSELRRRWRDAGTAPRPRFDAGTTADGGRTDSGPADGGILSDAAAAIDANVALDSGSPVTSRPGWQLTSANTGLAGVGLSCASLPLYAGGGKPTAGTVISGKRIETPLDLSAGNIVVEKSCIRPTSVGRGMPVLATTDYDRCVESDCPITPSLVTIRDCDIDGTLLGAADAAYATGFIGIATLQRNYIHDFGSGIGILNTGKTLSVTIEGNYVTKLRAYGDGATTGNHSDAFTVRDFDASASPSRQLMVRNNRFDCSSGNDTGAFFIQTYSGNIHNLVASGNLLEGAGYQMGLNESFGNTYSNLKAVDNRFSGTGYGPAYVQGGPGWSQWQDNFINDTSKVDNKGKAVSEP